MSSEQQLAGHYLRRTLQRSQHNIEAMTPAELHQHALHLLDDYRMSLSPERAAQLLPLMNDIVNDCIGLGPLTNLLQDASISEIMVNDFQTIFIERNGQLAPSTVTFANEAELLRVIERIITPLGRRLDSSQPMVDARLPDGSRINAVLGPLALRGSCLTIRKFLAKQLTFQELVAQGALSQAAANYLVQSVEARRNIVIAGGTGTGKTTLLNTLASAVPPQQRIVTIEDAAELKLSHDNLIALEARPANAEGKGQITIRELLINALRMRPDRIIVGECRGAEALDMLQAMNTGHEGSLTTLHANSAREALQRLEVMVLMAGFEIPLLAIRQQIVAAIDVIVHIKRTSMGQRVVHEISEVVGVDANVIQLNRMFYHDGEQLVETGVISAWT